MSEHSEASLNGTDVRLAAEAEALRRLNEASCRLWRTESLQDGLNEMLDAAIGLLGADMGNIQLLDPERRAMTIEAQRGFEQPFLDTFRYVAADDDSACGRALRNGERIVIQDVEAAAPYVPFVSAARAAGYRAVQSTPLIGRDGAPLGMISTHWRNVHEPSAQDLSRLDLYARLAANFIERCQADAVLRRQLASAQLLQETSTQLIQEGDPQALYERIVDAAVRIMGAQYASLQLLQPDGGGGELLLLAHRGFDAQAANFWQKDVTSGSTCGEVLRTRSRAIAPDVETCAFMKGTLDREVYLQTGIHAVQTTPLMARNGTLLGMISTHWSHVHTPSERELRILDVLARLAADLIERKEVEAALSQNEHKYRTLFDTIDEGFAIMEAVFDFEGKVEDLVFRQINLAYPTVVGFTPVIGRRAKDYVPKLDARWLDKYARVIATGEPCREEGYVQDIDSWLSVHLSLVGQRGSHLVAAVFNNITERKKAEIAIRESEERQAFLLKLSDFVRPLADPADVQGETTRLLREQLSAAWCYYVDWDLERKIGFVLRDSAREGLPSLAGSHDASDATEFLQLLASGAVLTVPDYAGYEQLTTRIRQKYVALGFRSMMVAPLVKDGRLIATLIVGDTEVRDWSVSEASLLVEVGERTWAAIERGRAEASLRETEELRRVALDSGGMGAWTWDTRAGTVSADTVVQKLCGVSTEEQPHAVSLYADLMSPESAAWLAAVAAKEIAPGEEFHTQVEVAHGPTSSRWVEIRGRAERETPWIINGVCFDITEQREWADRQDVMVAELQHRTRNLIAVVSAIAQQTMARTGPTQAFREEFNHRLEALARVQGLLSRSDEEPITIESLIRMELDALGAKAEPGRIEIEGPPVRIRRSAVQTLALALHELATNARKYGALSGDQGRLQVRWRTYSDTEGERIALEWVEAGSLPPEHARIGYGRELIERALPYSLKAKTSFQHDDAGLRCVIDMPMRRTKSRRTAT